MKKFAAGRESLIALILLSTFTIFLESCKKADTLTNPPLVEESPTQTPGNKNALPHTKQYSNDVATAWFVLLTDIVKTKPYGNPPALRIFAYSGMALYESVIPGMPSYQSMYKYLTGNSIDFDNKKDYYWPACANAAIARISSRIMQNYTNPNLASIQALEASLNSSYQSLVTPEQLQSSNEFGRYVADKIYDWSKTDGTLNSNGSLAACPVYVPLSGAGNWVPTPNNFLPAAGACQGSLRTFVPNIVNTLLPPPHPLYSTDPSSEFYQTANEVYQARLNITAEESRAFNNWRDIQGTNYTPPAHTLRIATEIIIKEKPDLEFAAEFFAKQTMAAADAIGAVFNAKFHYALLRPVTYIRNILGYTTWNSLSPAPQHPSYPDEMNATASTVAILENYLGTNYSFIDSTQKSLYGSFTYASLNDLLLDIGKARTHGGVTFDFCIDAGIAQGRSVAAMVNALPFKKP